MNVNGHEAYQETVSLEDALNEFENVVVDEEPEIYQELNSLTEADFEGADENTANQSDITDLEFDNSVTDEDLEFVDSTIKRERLYQLQSANAQVDSISINALQNKVELIGDDAKKKKNKSTKSKRAAHSLDTVPADLFVLDEDPAKLSQTELEEIKKNVIDLKPTQVKVAEKFTNLFISLANSREPSRYTRMAFTYLYDRGEVTSQDLVRMYQASGLREGTARSQTVQLMTLLSTVKIATRKNDTLTLLRENTITNRLHNLIYQSRKSAPSLEEEVEAFFATQCA